ncbi:hypothetical protein PYV02_06045 [Leifsonia sp. H3M29-4]|uniref:hypothetical protein n=1 Tax=Salinibacterium metalliresistens TaxID=3031321 RepID=UPI0023DAAE1C|nr:hypothetical protein [Salinibacterium metalliresistens]MDF1478644.1 hypothetical protein [Salinibacterium metalliresistens]
MTDENNAASSHGDYEARWLEIEASLGRLLVAWSRVEFYVSRVFLGVVELDEPAATVLVRRLTGDTMSDITLTLLKHRDPTVSEPIRTWLKAVKLVREDRNKLFHGTLVDQSDGVEWLPTNVNYTLDEGGVARLGGPRLTVKALADLRARMYDIQRDFATLPEIALRGIQTDV